MNLRSSTKAKKLKLDESVEQENKELDGVEKERVFKQENEKLDKIVEDDVRKYKTAVIKMGGRILFKKKYTVLEGKKDTVDAQKMYISDSDSDLKERLMVIIKIPKKLRCEEEDRRGNAHLNFCTSLGFFRSTGSSNEWSFAGIFLPFAGIAEEGKWVRKIGCLFLSPWHVPIMQYALNKLKKENLLKENGLSTLLMFKFLLRFGHWQMLQISAALGGPLWEAVPELRFIQEFILSHNLVKCHAAKSFMRIHTVSINADEMNVILLENELFEDKKFSEVKDKYEKSSNIIQEYFLLKEFETTEDLNKINAMVEKHKAMCYDPEQNKKDIELYMENRGFSKPPEYIRDLLTGKRRPL
jgi:hypothetical protein